jgi:hypothetical protein
MGGHGNSFFNDVKPFNMYNDMFSRQKIEKYLKQIVRFNVYIDAIVQKIKVEDNEIALRIVSSKLRNVW